MIERADSLLRVGNHEQARELSNEAVVLADSLFGSQDILAYRANFVAGQVRWATADYAAAMHYWGEALRIQEALQPDSLANTALICANLGSANHELGKIEVADHFYLRSVELYRKVLGDRHHSLAVVLNNRAILLVGLGKFSEAEPLLNEAIEINKSELGRAHPAVASSLRDLGEMYLEQNRLDDAESAFTEALDMQINFFLPDYPNSPEIGKTWGCFGALYAVQGRLALARQSYQRAIEILEVSLGAHHSEVAQILMDWAVLEAEDRQLKAADSLICLASERLDHATGTTYDGAVCLAKSAAIRSLLGNSEGAELGFTRALAALDSLFPDDYPVTLRCAEDYAMFLNTRGEFDRARNMMAQVFATQLDAFMSDASVLPERVAMQNGLNLQHVTGDYLSVLMSCPDSLAEWSEEIAKVALQTKGLVTRLITRRNLENHTASDTLQTERDDSLTTARFQLALLRLNRPSIVSSQYLEQLWAAASLKERLEADFADFGQRESQANLSGAAVIADVQAKLPPNTSLVDFLKYNHHLDEVSSEPRYIAVVWNSRSAPIVVDLGQAERIESAVSWYRTYFEQFASADPAEYDQISARLYGLIWQPLESAVGHPDNIVISPDGSLGLVSFAGLKRPDGSFFVEESGVQYTLSVADLVREQNSARTTSGLISFADPDFNLAAAKPEDSYRQTRGFGIGYGQSLRGSSTLQNLRLRNWNRLSGTSHELKRIEEVWGDTTDTVESFTGSDANVWNFVTRAPGHRIIHIATHGYYVEDLSREICNESLSEHRLAKDNPLLRCGIVLAGANSPEAGIESGLLTGEEIAGLELSGTELVILSACRTGVGDVKSNEGTFGLSRAFLLAGAQTVVSTLWPVEDSAAADLIPQALSLGLPLTSEKLRNAMLQTLEERRNTGKSTDPYYWAAFTLSGSLTKQ